MAVRKSGVCEICKETLYGDEYGALGHRCIQEKTEQEIIQEITERIEKLHEEEMENRRNKADHNSFGAGMLSGELEGLRYLLEWIKADQ